MILVPCPWCGRRNVSEFRHVGEQTTRPDPATVRPQEWRAFLYVRDNPAGWTTETWFHRAGCRQYFLADRHTVTNEVRDTRPPAAAEAMAQDAEQAAAGGVYQEGPR